MSVNTTITADLTAKREALRTALGKLGYDVQGKTWGQLAAYAASLFFIDATAQGYNGSIYDDSTAPAEVRGLTVKDFIANMFARTAEILEADTQKRLTNNKFYDNTELLFVTNDYVLPSNTTSLANCFRNASSIIKTPFNVDIRSDVNPDETEAITRHDSNSMLASPTHTDYVRTYHRPLRYKASSYTQPAVSTAAVTNMSQMFVGCSMLGGKIRIDASACGRNSALNVFMSTAKTHTLVIDNMSDVCLIGQMTTQCNNLRTILGININNRIGALRTRNTLLYQEYNIEHIELVQGSVICFNSGVNNGTYEICQTLSLRNNANNNLDADTLMQLVEAMYDWTNDPDEQGGAVGYKQGSSKTLYEKLVYYELASNRRTYNGTVLGVNYSSHTTANPIDARNTITDSANYAPANWNSDKMSANDYNVCRYGLSLCFSVRNMQTLADAGLLATADSLAKAKGWRLTESDVVINGTTYEGLLSRPTSDFE